MNNRYLSLFDNKTYDDSIGNPKKSRCGAFTDNMRLPIHRWYRYSAGFSATWIKNLIQNEKCSSIIDPFVGSGTVSIVADELGIASCGYEAQPFVFKIAKAKLSWNINHHDFHNLLLDFLKINENSKFDDTLFTKKLMYSCFDKLSLKRLLQYKYYWQTISNNIEPRISSLLFLAITAILRICSHAGTAQWQYIQPKKSSKTVAPEIALRSQVENMLTDILFIKRIAKTSNAIILNQDSRNINQRDQSLYDLAVTSPPYANNYDYADATRFEMTFWGEVNGWGDLHEKARKNLICSSSQHASKENLNLSSCLKLEELNPIKNEIEDVCNQLSTIRLTKGGKKNYHLMVAKYFIDLSQVISNLQKLIKPGGKVFIVIGDSAPYGIYVPVEKWIGELAVAAGFISWEFDKIRDRNIKWKNRKHRVPLKEGLLTIYN